MCAITPASCSLSCTVHGPRPGAGRIRARRGRAHANPHGGPASQHLARVPAEQDAVRVDLLALGQEGRHDPSRRARARRDARTPSSRTGNGMSITNHAAHYFADDQGHPHDHIHDGPSHQPRFSCWNRIPRHRGCSSHDRSGPSIHRSTARSAALCALRRPLAGCLGDIPCLMLVFGDGQARIHLVNGLLTGSARHQAFPRA